MARKKTKPYTLRDGDRFIQQTRRALAVGQELPLLAPPVLERDLWDPSVLAALNTELLQLYERYLAPIDRLPPWRGQKNIARQLGITPRSFRKWLERNPIYKPMFQTEPGRLQTLHPRQLLGVYMLFKTSTRRGVTEGRVRAAGGRFQRKALIQDGAPGRGRRG